MTKPDWFEGTFCGKSANFCLGLSAVISNLLFLPTLIFGDWKGLQMSSWDVVFIIDPLGDIAPLSVSLPILKWDSLTEP